MLSTSLRSVPDPECDGFARHRREGLCSSHRSTWRAQRDRGAVEELALQRDDLAGVMPEEGAVVEYVKEARPEEAEGDRHTAG